MIVVFVLALPSWRRSWSVHRHLCLGSTVDRVQSRIPPLTRSSWMSSRSPEAGPSLQRKASLSSSWLAALQACLQRLAQLLAERWGASCPGAPSSPCGSSSVASASWSSDALRRWARPRKGRWARLGGSSAIAAATPSPHIQVDGTCWSEGCPFLESRPRLLPHESCMRSLALTWPWQAAASGPSASLVKWRPARSVPFARSSGTWRPLGRRYLFRRRKSLSLRGERWPRSGRRCWKAGALGWTQGYRCGRPLRRLAVLTT
mmetsp:Transcript_103731/g.302754  ORF Transcript_103731/g.302754 Transcript_103731/m.302754 type:complete len:261 (-) Transcript_103731:450-1232(-)